MASPNRWTNNDQVYFQIKLFCSESNFKVYQLNYDGILHVTDANIVLTPVK